MSTPIIAEFKPVCNPRYMRIKRATVPPVYNPVRRLVAAVMLQAVSDAYSTAAAISDTDRHEAAQFLNSTDGRFMLAELLGRPS